MHGHCSPRRECLLYATCSCKHGGLASMNGTLGSGKLDVLEEGALDGSPSGRDKTSSGWQLKYKRGASVVVVCLLLTLGSLIVPKSGHGLGSVKVSVSTPVHGNKRCVLRWSDGMQADSDRSKAGDAFTGLTKRSCCR
jgi:hypothetical protein